MFLFSKYLAISFAGLHSHLDHSIALERYYYDVKYPGEEHKPASRDSLRRDLQSSSTNSYARRLSIDFECEEVSFQPVDCE